MSFTFSPLIFHGLYSYIKDTGGEISWSMLHEMCEKDGNLVAMETLILKRLFQMQRTDIIPA